jgi:hypothetical protein
MDIEITTLTWITIGAWLISSAFLTLLFLSAAGPKTPEEQRRDDEEQYRWICETQFIVTLDRYAKRYGHPSAWQKAAWAAHRQIDHNIKRWSNQQLLDAIRALRAGRRTLCGS